MKPTLIQRQSRLRSAERQSSISAPDRNRVGVRSARQLATPVWPWLVVILVIAVAVLAAKPVSAFSLGPIFDNGTPSDKSDDLLDAPRWSDLPGSYVEDGVRGLGGGLEYSISAEFCANLIPQFVDSPSCEEIRHSVQQTFDIWAKGHIKIRFEDVSDRVETELPPASVNDPWNGYGAEIDLLALSPDEYASVDGYGAWTQFWYLFADPMGTNGQILPGNSLTAADIVMNSEACFYLDRAMAVDGCNDFGFLLLHEIGHVFGLGHSSDAGNGYFDTDFDPLNPMLIDCESPHEGLVLSTFINPNSVMNLDRWEQVQTRMELSTDEIGALRFLYPFCSDDSDVEVDFEDDYVDDFDEYWY